MVMVLPRFPKLMECSQKLVRTIRKRKIIFLTIAILYLCMKTSEMFLKPKTLPIGKLAVEGLHIENCKGTIEIWCPRILQDTLL